MKMPLFCQQMAKEWYFLLAKHCLEEFKLDCQLRRLTDRTIKGYYNNTLNFLIYAEKHHSITEVEEIYTLHIKHYVQYLLSKKLTAAYTNNILKCLRAYFRFAIQEEYIYRITFGMDAERPVDLEAITTEEFCDMEQTLALRLLEAFENNDAMLDPIYELLGEAA